MEVEKLVYLVGPVVATIALYIRYRWRKQAQMQQKQKKKDNQSSFGQNVSGID
jgi:hypothetical protein